MPSVSRLVVIAGLIAGLTGCSGDAGDSEPARFEEHHRDGDVAFTIVGDYFHPRYAAELVHIARALSPRARQVVFCTQKYEHALGTLLPANDVENVEYRTLDPKSPVLRQWARDVAVAGDADGETRIIVSPDKHATTEPEAVAIGDLLKEAFPACDVRVAPFVFEGGNLVFVNQGDDRVLIVGRKVIFDNDVYQRRDWAPGHDRTTLLEEIAETFDVDTVLVVGRASVPPDTRMYFEYHIDMGMAVLDDNRAVVSRLEFLESDRDALAAAIRAGHPVVSPFGGQPPGNLLAQLSGRLESVAAEYEEYALLLESLGVEVHRSQVTWQHVLASMSWTNVVQAGDRILMPVYPDSLMGVTRSVESAGGQLRVSVDVSRVMDEEFETDLNLRNQRLYESLGYEVVPVPEYLHYMMGGIHCFVNVID